MVGRNKVEDLGGGRMLRGGEGQCPIVEFWPVPGFLFLVSAELLISVPCLTLDLWPAPDQSLTMIFGHCLTFYFWPAPDLSLTMISGHCLTFYFWLAPFLADYYLPFYNWQVLFFWFLASVFLFISDQCLSLVSWPVPIFRFLASD